ncbi:MAG: YegP family protein [Clostridia bacterium]|nr:YegP family protein [Clostridia bacterium]
MGKFVIKQTATGFKFDLKAGNGEVIATSEIYTTEAACIKGLESVKACCVGEVEDQTVEPVEAKKHPKFELYADKSGEYRFRLKAKNGQIIATSESYKTKTSAENGIESVKKNAPEAEVTKAE